MRYTEYGNKIEYKIVIAKKKYFFRDALKLYLDNYSNKDSIGYKKSQKIIDTILSVIKDYGVEFEIDNKKRIIFKMSIITALADKNFLAKNSKLTASIVEFYRKKGIISRYSKPFASVHKDYDSNRLIDCFTVSNFSRSDVILDIRDELLSVIKNPFDENHEIYLYNYMKAFSIKQYPQEVYENFNRNKLYNFDGTIALIYDKQFSNEYTTVRVIYFDYELNNALKEAFFTQSENLLERIDHYFDEPFVTYDKLLDKYLKNIYQRITKNNLQKYSKRYFTRMIRQVIELDYEFDSSPVHHTLQKETRNPPTNYLELRALYPEIINNQEYIDVELENIKKQRQHVIIEEDEIEQLTLNDYLELEVNIYDDFRKFKQYSKSKIKSRKDHEAYVARLDKFILKHQESFKFPEMFYYVKHIIFTSKFNKESEHKLEVSTIYNNNLCILFANCFNIIIQEGRIDVDVQESIKNKIENLPKQETKSKYYAAINPFLDLYGYAIDYNKSTNTRYARRSLIFKKELDELFDILKKQDSELYSMTGLIASQRVVIYQRFLFCMLLYYTGLRESELWSRTVKDVFIKDDYSILVDVNKNEIVKSFKTYSARRRVEFTIDDQRYFEIFQEYLHYLEKNRVKYLFSKISDTKKFLKKEIQDIDYFLKSADLLKEITNRYVSLHSFRHTYITKSIRALVLKTKKDKSDFYNIINMAGHLGPDVTLRYYAHIDYILNFLDTENLF